MTQEHDCLITGKCALHDVEIERRKLDRREIDEIKQELKKQDLEQEGRLIDMHKRTNAIENKVVAVFLSLGLLLVIILGNYYYINIVDFRHEKHEATLALKISDNRVEAKQEREQLVNQVVTLLTADAEQKQWQKGMMTQLELLNAHIRDIVDLKYQPYKQNKNKNKNDKDEVYQ